MLRQTVNDSESSIPLIDWESSQENLVTDIALACRDYGFFYLKNHDIPNELITSMFSLSKSYFSLPHEEKLKFLTGRGHVGYIDFGQERLDSEHPQPEPKEAFNLSNIPNTEENKSILPPHLYKEFVLFQQFEKECNQLGRAILRLLAQHLEIGINEGGDHFFEEKHHLESGRRSSSTIRILHYVPDAFSQLEEHEKPHDIDGEEIRCGCHSDYGMLTFLFQDNVGGLQVLRPREDENSPRQVLSVKPIPGCVVVNCGDLMQLWTDSYFISAQHRVVTPKDEVTGKRLKEERYSFAYFMHPDDEVLINPILSSDKIQAPQKKWPPTRRFEHKRMQELAQRLGPSYNAIQYAYGRLDSTYI